MTRHGLDDFTTYAFTSGGRSRTIYRRGAGPGVVVLHVLPGIIPGVVRFADRVADAAFTVFMPRILRTAAESSGSTRASTATEFLPTALGLLVVAMRGGGAGAWRRRMAGRTGATGSRIE